MLHSNRIGQGLPISTIIIAAIGLIVLIIMIVLVQQRTTIFSKSLKNASEDVCAPTNEIRATGTDCEVIYATFTDLGPGQICCRKGTAK
ncbi:Uncharacterised protein [uncultured archaeon]|nr:Uncharacterised protein [uncultured archaeon]